MLNGFVCDPWCCENKINYLIQSYRNYKCFNKLFYNIIFHLQRSHYWYEECMCRLRNIANCVTTKKVWLLDRHTDRRTDRRRTKWSLCAAMLRRRHNKATQYNYVLFHLVKLWNYLFISSGTCKWKTQEVFTARLPCAPPPPPQYRDRHSAVTMMIRHSISNGIHYLLL